MNLSLALFLAAAVAVIVALLTRQVLGWLQQRQIMDIPNERSSHVHPTPRGGGLGVVPVVLLAWGGVGAASGHHSPWLTAAVLAGGVLLAAVSWMDDVRSLSPLPRFIAQAVAVGVVLSLMPSDALVLQGSVPLWLDRLLAGLGWLWFVNLYNFMDGIDGITGVESASITAGLALLAALGLAPPGLFVPSLVIVGAALGFLYWNWHPAKVFLGDVGSVPLGFLIGFLLVVLAAHGKMASALILPLYYLVDVTGTLFVRLARGEKPWQAHRSHLFQRAVQGSASHAQVSGLVGMTGVGLIVCALAAAVGHEGEGLLMAAVLVVLTCSLLLYWARGGRQATAPLETTENRSAEPSPPVGS